MTKNILETSVVLIASQMAHDLHIFVAESYVEES